MKLEVLEADYEQSQTDLRLAFKRITDLQAVIEDEMESGEDSDYRSVDIIYRVPAYDTSMWHGEESGSADLQPDNTTKSNK